MRPWLRQGLVLSFLTIQNTTLVLVTKFSVRENATPYSVSAVVACAELVKLFLSYLLTLGFHGKRAFRDALCELPVKSRALVVPSALYVVQNNLLFHGVKLLSPTLYMVCSQSKILTSAAWNVLLLGTRINLRQCVSLAILVTGMILVQHGEASRQKISASSNFGETLTGALLVFIAAVTSGFAGAYLEKMYTDGRQERSVWFRNAQLACFSFPVASMLVLWRDVDLVRGGDIFHGFDRIVLCVIILQAIGGLIVAAVLRYAGNVLKCFAISISICACVMASAFSQDEGRQISMVVLLGIGLVLYATFLYSNII